MSAIMKELGGALSLRGGLSALRINIVDSDFGSSGMTAAGRRSDATRGKVRSFLIKVISISSFHCMCFIFMIGEHLVDDANA